MNTAIRRIHWLALNYAGVARHMNANEIKETLIGNPANSEWADLIAGRPSDYVRHDVAKTLGWTRKNRRRTARKSAIAPAPTVRQTPTPTAVRGNRLTFNIGGCTITVPRGVNIEVL